MAKMKLTQTFTRPVTVLQPGEKKQQQITFDAEYQKVTSEQREKAYEKGGLKGVLDLVLVSVSGLEIDDLPDGMTVKEAVIIDEPSRHALMNKYNEEVKGVERKNLRL